ncbi:3'-5' exonuclease [Deinococcus maricopensis]|uniref:Exonuclease RNase T and DNA polymerase III n=1 Tax=Deinococcus maricopensis (strain DSM 21211 / LMG 22137 / NRRL B-23946 / LB-34) TaxID=709986 RepID=E8U4N6_DEIML|nr:3'-5' exonuclease [Deinococcus maricopensis]ADV68901.1 Exonuclease RNase T and DNA polymerase III [Deinococcus maricopensis DSM 21211]
MNNLLNVIDVEATCWDGPTPPGQTNEIIEVGICVVDLRTLERVDRRRVMVRPGRSEISAFCTDLTGITARDVADGVTFTEACAILRRELHADSRPWASWGDYDRKQFERQCVATGTPYPFSARHTNAKAQYALAHTLRRMGMAEALQHAGLPLEGRHHRGEDDAWNIAALILGLLRGGRWPST